MESKPTRGRPKGSGIDDTPTLMKIAAIVAADPDIKRTTAIKQAGISNPSHIRRLRDKFSAEESKLIKLAKSGKTPAPAKPAKAAASKAAAKPATKTTTRAKAEKAPTKAAAPKAAAKSRATAAAKPAKAAAKTATSPRKTAAAPKAATKAKAAAKPARKASATASKAQSAPAAVAAAMNGAAKAASGAAMMADAAPKSPSELATAMSNANWMTPGFEAMVSGIVEGQIQLFESAMKNSPMATYLRQQALLIDMTLSMMKSQQQSKKPAGRKAK